MSLIGRYIEQPSDFDAELTAENLGPLWEGTTITQEDLCKFLGVTENSLTQMVPTDHWDIDIEINPHNNGQAWPPPIRRPQVPPMGPTRSFLTVLGILLSAAQLALAIAEVRLHIFASHEINTLPSCGINPLHPRLLRFRT